MKTITVLILFTFIVFLASGQEVIKAKILKDVEVSPPSFMGVKTSVLDMAKSTSIYDYLDKAIEYPKRSEDQLREGCVVIQFTVLENGKLDNFEVINSVTNDIDEEVIRVLESTDGMWNPGKNNGYSVAMEKEVAITFKIGESNHVKLAQKFYRRAIKKFEQNKYRKTLRLLDHALVYQPYDKTVLLKRGQTKLLTGNMDGACQDWNRLKFLGSDLADVYLEKHCEMDDYAVNK